MAYQSSNSPLISIITVTFNAGIKLEKTILSVINQSYNNIEFLVIDGGSTDDTSKIVKKFKSNIDYYISEPDNGIYDAMNKGIAAATGDWIYFLGAGDLLLDVLKDVQASLKNEQTIYYGDVIYSDTKKVYDGQFSGFKLAVANICHQAIFYPAKVFSKYKFNTKYKLLADHDLNMRCYGDKDFHFKYIDKVICIYEGGGLSHLTPDPAFYKDKIRVIEANFPLPVFLYALARRTLAKIIKKQTN